MMDTITEEMSMEILPGKSYLEFMAFLPEIKIALSEWKLVNIKIIDGADSNFTIDNVSELIQKQFHDKEGRIYICNRQELLMLVKEGRNSEPKVLTQKIEGALPQGKCEIQVEPPTLDNISKLSITVNFEKSLSELAMKRKARVEKIILIADDDMYMRMLIKKGIGSHYTVQEVIHGSEIVAAYKKYLPDILFLDIHMPGKDGLENLEAILTYDPQAYIIMLSSDSSPENVIWTTKHGAKGFIAKPFAKDKLVEYVKKCPTII